MDDQNLSQEDWLDQLWAGTSAAEPAPTAGDTKKMPRLKKESEEEEELEQILREYGSAEPEPPAQEETFKDDDFRETFGEGEDLKQVFEKTPVPPVSEESQEKAVEESEEEGPVEKGRPKRKKGEGLFGLPHLAATAIWLALPKPERWFRPADLSSLSPTGTM